MTSGFYNYLKLVKNTTPYAKRLDRLSNRIFGEVAKPTSDKSMRVSLTFNLCYIKEMSMTMIDFFHQGCDYVQ